MKGVSRINLTHEYVRAATTYDLHYADFKLDGSRQPGTQLFARRKACGASLKLLALLSQPVPLAPSGTKSWHRQPVPLF